MYTKDSFEKQEPASVFTSTAALSEPYLSHSYPPNMLNMMMSAGQLPGAQQYSNMAEVPSQMYTSMSSDAAPASVHKERPIHRDSLSRMDNPYQNRSFITQSTDHPIQNKLFDPRMLPQQGFDAAQNTYTRTMLPSPTAQMPQSVIPVSGVAPPSWGRQLDTSLPNQSRMTHPMGYCNQINDSRPLLVSTNACYPNTYMTLNTPISPYGANGQSGPFSYSSTSFPFSSTPQLATTAPVFLDSVAAKQFCLSPCIPAPSLRPPLGRTEQPVPSYNRPQLPSPTSSTETVRSSSENQQQNYQGHDPWKPHVNTNVMLEQVHYGGGGGGGHPIISNSPSAASHHDSSPLADTTDVDPLLSLPEDIQESLSWSDLDLTEASLPGSDAFRMGGI